MEKLQPWFDRRLAFFRRKAQSPHEGPAPALSAIVGTAPEAGEWEGVWLDWTPWGAVARPLALNLEDSSATLDGRTWRRDRVVLQDESDDAGRLFLVAHGDEAIGVFTVSGVPEAEVYLVRVDGQRCGRTSWSESTELVAVMAISLAMAAATLAIAGAGGWWIALGIPLGALWFCRSNVKQRRDHNVGAWRLVLQGAMDTWRSNSWETINRAFGFEP